MRWLAAVLCCLLIATVHAEDQVLSTRVGEVDVSLFIPGEAKVLRGLIIHATNYKMNPADRWAEMCRAMSWGHVALDIDRKLNNRPKKLRAGLDEGMKQFAQHSGHPELVNLPLAGVGHSAGGMVTPAMLFTPARTITSSVSCGWISDPAKFPAGSEKIPLLFTIGAVNDAFNMVPGVEASFYPARSEGRPWALGFMWGCAHDFANSATIFVPWTQAIADLRIPSDWDPLKGEPSLKEIKVAEGWLGDCATWDNTWATVAPYAEFKADKAKSVWLPNRSVAYVWRAFQSKGAPVVLNAATADGSAKLPAYSEKAERGMMVDPGRELLLSVSVKEGTSLRRVQFLEGDRPIGEATAAPWQAAWKSIPQGPHAILAIYETTDGRQGTTTPALVTVRAKAAP